MILDHVAMRAELAKVTLAFAIVIALCAGASVIQDLIIWFGTRPLSRDQSRSGFDSSP